MEKGVILAKNIEMNVQSNDGSYEVLYPQSVSDIILNSEALREMWGLVESTTLDDAFKYLQRQLILMQYNKAGVNVILKTSSGTPISDITISGITANYDNTGTCVTNNNGEVFGYCDAGNVTVGVNCVDMNNSTQQINAIATRMYTVELNVTLNNFIKIDSTRNDVVFSDNVERIDVTCVGGGGGGGMGRDDTTATVGPAGGGGGGYVTVQENISFTPNLSYSAIVGAGGYGHDSDNYTSDGGQSSFNGIIANGGKLGLRYDSEESTGVYRALGNGTGGSAHDQYGRTGSNGTVQGYLSFTELTPYGGGGGSGDYGSVHVGGMYGGSGGSGWKGPRSTPGQNGFGGGGGGGSNNNNGVQQYRYGASGGSGCVAIRMHLKVTS